MKFQVIYIVFFLLMLSSHIAIAAPFCAESQSVSPDCSYYEASECKRQAYKIAGLCVLNTREVKIPGGYGNVCLVYPSTVVECLYLDFPGCEREANKSDGICVRNTSKREPAPAFKYETEGLY